MGSFDYDLVVIGGGSGGVRAARFSAAAGARVAIVEERDWGGTCVNVGCIPKKLFGYAAHYSEEFRDARRFGWSSMDPCFDWPTLRDNKTAEITRLNGIYVNMLKDAGCSVLEGRARLAGPHEVDISGQRFHTANILVATGGWPYVPDIPGRDHAITSNECFFLDELPRSIVIVGGGYIAAEFAGIFHGLGVEVTQLYRGELFLRGFDDDIRRHLAGEMRTKGIDLRFSSDVAAITRTEDGFSVSLTDGASLDAGLVMYATGRRPLTSGLGLEEAGVAVNDDGTIPVDDHFRTNVPSVFAIGDVLGRMELTPVATTEGMAVAATLFGYGPKSVDYTNIPSAVFSQPELATVGLTESEARRQYADGVDIYMARFRPLRHTISLNEEKTLMKLVVASATDRVVGVHMVGEDAAEILQGLAVALKAGATKADFDATVGIHPTSAEEFVTMRQKAA